MGSGKCDVCLRFFDKSDGCELTVTGLGCSSVDSEPIDLCPNCVGRLFTRGWPGTVRLEKERDLLQRTVQYLRDAGSRLNDLLNGYYRFQQELERRLKELSPDDEDDDSLRWGEHLIPF